VILYRIARGILQYLGFRTAFVKLGGAKLGEKYNVYMKIATKQAGLVFTIRILGYILGFANQTIFARFLGVDKYGLYSLGLTIVNIGVIFSVFGMNTGIARFLGEYLGKNEFDKAKGVIKASFELVGILSIVLAFLLYIFRKPISVDIFHDERLSSILPWFSLILIIGTFTSLFFGIFQGLKKPFIFYLYKDVVEKILKIPIFLTFYFFGYELFGAIFSLLVSGIFVLTQLFIKLRKNADFIFDKSITPSVYRTKLLKYSSNMLFVKFAYFLMGQVNRIILGTYLNSTSVGLYSISDTIAQLSIFFFIAFEAIFTSIISELYHTGETSTLSKMYSDITRWIVSLTIPFSIWMIIFSKHILTVFGPEYTKAQTVLILLVVGQSVNAITGSNGLMLLMTKFQRYEMLNSVLIAGLNILLNIMLVPRYGIVGSAIGGMLAITSVNIVKSLEVYMALRMTPYNRKYFKPIIAGIVTTFVVLMLKNLVSGIIGAFIMLGISFLIMVGVLVILGLYPEDKEILMTIMKKFNR